VRQEKLVGLLRASLGEQALRPFGELIGQRGARRRGCGCSEQGGEMSGLSSYR
jgi:hypothetical protein